MSPALVKGLTKAFDTSGFHTTLTRSTWKILTAMIRGPRRRSRSVAQHWAWGDNSWYVSRVICATISCMLSICPNDYVLHISCKCAKQPERSVLCGYYAYEYLRACSSYSHSMRQLKKSLEWWWKEKVDSRNITQTVADICKFVTDECCHVGGNFFYAESELGMAEKYQRLHNWRTSELDMKDYKLLDIF
jgi:hypothetical protein